jgi:hypothetical protein
MIILSYNCRGLASPPKKSSLKRMVDMFGPSIILLHETMGQCDNVKKALETCLLGWNFEVVDAVGRSGGLEIGWLQRKI